MIERPSVRFRFRLAAYLGFAHPRHMLAALTARELVEWEQFLLLEPTGAEHDYRCAGIVAATVANNAMGAARRDRKPGDYVPPLPNAPARKTSRAPSRPRTTETRRRVVADVAAVFGVPLKKRTRSG